MAKASKSFDNLIAYMASIEHANLGKNAVGASLRLT